MKPSTTAHEQLLNNLVVFAQAQPDIRAVIVVGSRARVEQPADIWADWDLVVYTTAPNQYLESPGWLAQIGQVQVQARQPTAANNPELLLLFNEGMAVDIVLMDCRGWKLGLPIMTFLQNYHLLPKRMRKQMQIGAQLYHRGTRVLLDKDGLVPWVRRAMGSTSPPPLPTETEFQENVRYFWCLTEKVSRKIGRGELYVAHVRLESLHQGVVLQMIEWHARATLKCEQDTWYAGRFLEQWADPRVLSGLQSAFAHYDANDLWQALFSTMDLFRWLAQETAEQLGYRFPVQGDDYVTALIKKRLDDTIAGSGKG